ncbi:MAG: amidophosphoribosyltransferase [Flavobacteriaceae bacterium]|tara:strand:- start:86 stop:1981 length:1896 start_codon:yes stop_codon:yes gene_type:complete
MSDAIKHECGIALVRLLKPLNYYKEKYGSSFYGLQKMYLMLEKQHNRGQDGAGFASIKLDMEPGERFMSRVRSCDPQPIKDIFNTINTRINNVEEGLPTQDLSSKALKSAFPYVGELMLGHLRYGTFGKNTIESVHPFLRQNNWMHRNLIVAGNFNLTNVNELFENLVALGQHPKEKADTVTVMEKIGHFLDDSVAKLYKKLKSEGFDKQAASSEIAKRLNIAKILRKASKNWDGGYVIGGLLGHGDSFVLRDPAGIRPAFFYRDDEVVVVASERPAIQTVFDVPMTAIREINPGDALIIKKSGEVSNVGINAPTSRLACSFERIYFSRGNDADIYNERKALGRLLFPKIHDSVNGELKNTVFSYIPNTAETSFYGLVQRAQDFMLEQSEAAILKEDKLSPDRLKALLSPRPRIEKVILKDVKLRTFITEDSSRDDLVAHVYDITYGSVNKDDNLVIIDDSIVRGTTLQKSILKILDRLGPKKIVVVSSAPQIRYPDCYGIDMARLEDLIAFRAMLALLEKNNKNAQLKMVYEKAKATINHKTIDIQNHVKPLYDQFTDVEISEQISVMLRTKDINAEVDVIFQSVANLHEACPKNKGDWYFTGNYPTDGGNKVVNQAYINFYEGKKGRAY